MIAGILKVSAKIIAGIFLFYLLLCLIIVPLIVPWAVGNRASKLLNCKVSVRSVQFNPFLLRLSVYGLKIAGRDKKIIAGFKKFWADLSFVRLFVKEYRIESIGLDGLFVNAEMLPDGRVNLLELIPQDPKQYSSGEQAPLKSNTEKPAAGSAAGQGAGDTIVNPKPPVLPLVVIDLITFQRGVFNFADHTVKPEFSTSLHDIDIKITGVSTRPDCRAEVVLKALLDNKGVIDVQSRIDPFALPLQCEMSFRLNDYALDVLTPYAGKYTGRSVKDGKIDIGMEYRIADNKITASHKISVQRFDFGEKVESKDALNLPFGLVVALLEDPQGRISISLPVKGNMNDPDFEYGRLVFQVVRNFFLKLVTQPFMFLSSMLGSETGTEEFGTVRFVPGKAGLSDSDKEKMSVVVNGLNQRPKLYLEINGSYDPQIDWKAVKTDILNKDYQELKGRYNRGDKWTYQELYQRRFGIMSLWTVTKEMRARNEELSEADFTAELKRRLIEDAPVDIAVMNALAKSRAGIVYDYIISAGFDRQRVKIGNNKIAQAAMDTVPLEFTLTVFEESSKANKPADEPLKLKGEKSQ